MALFMQSQNTITELTYPATSSARMNIVVLVAVISCHPILLRSQQYHMHGELLDCLRGDLL